MTRALAAAWAPLALGVALVGCNCGPKVSSTGSDVSVNPTALDFGNVWVGSSATLTFEVHNGSMSPTMGMFSLVTGDGFALPSQIIEVEGGVTSNVRVTFTPQDAGAVQGSFVFTDDAFMQPVQLTANGVTPGACAAPTTCLTFSFDFDAGACASHAQNEGMVCADSCVDVGVCRGGVCSGAAIDCDDGNACTADGCGATGCLHVDSSASCPSPSDPCQAAACDPHTGCTSTQVADGVSCGTNDCSTAHVCIAGACVERPAVNGSVCQAATPCMGAGTCQSGTCKSGTVNLLVPEWQYLSPDGGIPSALALDDDGNIYFTEQRAVLFTSSVVSLTAQGAVRWRFDDVTSTTQPPTVDLAFGQIYVLAGPDPLAPDFNGGGPILYGLTLDGGRQRLGLPLGDGSTTLREVTLSGTAPVFTVLEDSGDSGVSKLDFVGRASADVTSQLSVQTADVFGDGQGNFLLREYGSGHARLELIDANNQPSWSEPIAGDVSADVLALSGDTIVIDSLSSMDQLQTLSLATHSTPRPLGSQTLPFTFAVMDATTLWAQGDTLVGFDLATGAALPFSASSLSSAIAPTARGLLYALIPDVSGLQDLFEVDQSGATVTFCPVSRALLDVIIVPGHVLGHTSQGVVSYAFPGIAPTSGWVTSRGSTQRDGQAH